MTRTTIRTGARLRSALAAVLLLPFATFAAGAQTADTRPIIAVLPFDNNAIGPNAGDYANIGRGIADLLTTELAGAGSRVRVVERARIDEILREQNLSRDGRVDPETAVRVGRILGASYMVTGGFMTNGGRQVTLTARTIRVDSTVVGNPRKVMGSTDDVFGVIDRLTASLATDMQLEQRVLRTGDGGAGTRTVAVAKDPLPAAGSREGKLDVRTTLLYGRALAAHDEGDRAKAIEYYNQVLERMPAFQAARENRDRLQGAGR